MNDKKSNFKVHYFQPFALDKNLGAAYNQCMEMIKDENDWACFTDADTMFMTHDYGQIIHKAIRENPNTGMFTCYTNRVGNKAQLHQKKMSQINNVFHHRRVAIGLQRKYGSKVQRLKLPISGHMMIIQKKTWKSCKFPKGLLGVDNKISQRLLHKGRLIHILKGIYIFHYYRMLEGDTFKKHLK